MDDGDSFASGEEVHDGWYVTSGTADLHNGEALNWYDDGSLNHINLDGSSLGIIAKDLETVSGQTYIVSFDYAKHLGARNLTRDFTVSGGSESEVFTAEAIRSWDNGSFEFTATESNTQLSFASNSSSGSIGTLLDNIVVTAK